MPCFSVDDRKSDEGIVEVGWGRTVDLDGMVEDLVRELVAHREVFRSDYAGSADEGVARMRGCGLLTAGTRFVRLIDVILLGVVFVVFFGVVFVRVDALG
jgi:hypothetical protein